MTGGDEEDSEDEDTWKPPPANLYDNVKVNNLIDMGFSKVQAESALSNCDDNFDDALALLLSESS